MLSFQDKKSRTTQLTTLKAQIQGFEEQISKLKLDLEKLKNENFGFKCLHYSVSEASGHITIIVLNKTGFAGRVRVKTINDLAKAGDDYEAVDEVLVFAQGQKQTSFDVTINDDDNWEPDEDFYVQLYDPET